MNERAERYCSVSDISRDKRLLSLFQNSIAIALLIMKFTLD